MSSGIHGATGEGGSQKRRPVEAEWGVGPSWASSRGPVRSESRDSSCWRAAEREGNPRRVTGRPQRALGARTGARTPRSVPIDRSRERSVRAIERFFLSPPELSRRFACSESRSIQFPGFVYDSSRDVIRRHIAFDASGSPEGRVATGRRLSTAVKLSATRIRGEVVRTDSAVVDERASAAEAKREKRGK